ncbi:MAG TPA: DMT family transporter [Nitrososphaerales archaeon]|nr:DMT family transporter [Nitrososphaerales archaeon]
MEGIFLLTTRGDFGHISRSQLTGDLFYLVSATSWGVYILYNKRKTDEKRWDPVSVASLTILSTALFVSPVMLTVGPAALSMTERGWGVILYTALLNTAIPFILYQRGLRYLTATASSMLLMLEIVTAMGISILLLGELLDLASLVGAASILSSIFLVSRVGGSGESLSIRTPGGLAGGGDV